MPIATSAPPPVKKSRATIDDVERAGRIFRKLADFVDEQGFGFSFTDSMGFAVPELSSGRESFSPDVAYYPGPAPAKPMKFIRGTPDFAVEVRSEGDFGPAAERDMEEKRADYFEAGTKVVWDVEPEAKTIRSYRAGTAEPIVFNLGEDVHAEPALPG